MKTELNTVYAADTSPVSLYEYFHISPIKVGVWQQQQQSASLIGLQSQHRGASLCCFFCCVSLWAAAPEFLSEHRRRRRPEGAAGEGAHPRPVAQPAAEEHRSHTHRRAGRRLQVHNYTLLLFFF